MTRIVDDILQTLLDRDPPGQEIHREADEYGDIIVTEHKQYRMLRFDELYEQSKVSMRAPASPIHHYIKAMLMAIAWREEGDVLLLGLGAAACCGRCTLTIPTGGLMWWNCAPACWRWPAVISRCRRPAA
ncbi:hypothetical protein GGER_44680 [Serratia rubidaea]